MYRDVIAVKGGLDQLTSMLEKGVNGELPPEWYEKLHTVRVTPLSKDHNVAAPQGNTRPVAPPEVLKKILHKIVMKSKTHSHLTFEQRVRAEFRSSNIFTLSGPEAMLRSLRVAVAEFSKVGATPIVVKFDCANGYGSVRIAWLLSRLYQMKALRPILRPLFVSVGIPITVLVRGADSLYHFLLHNTTSLMQGDVLAPILFSLAVMPALESAREEMRKALNCNAVDYFALIDDVVWILPPVPGAVETAQQILAEHLKQVGLTIAPKKTAVLKPESMRSAEDAHFIDVLGTPFFFTRLSAAWEAKAQQFVRDRILVGARGQRVAEKLQALTEPHWRKFSFVAFQLMRRVFAPSVVYQVRNTHPSITMPALIELDELMVQTAEAHLGKLSQVQRRILALPLRMGGRGILRTASIAVQMYQAARNREGAASRDLVAAAQEREYHSIVELLSRQLYDLTDPLLKTQCRRQLHHLAKFDPRSSAPNASSRMLEYASYVSGDAYRDHVNMELGAMPLAQLPELCCEVCRKKVPAHQRDTHHLGCERLSRIPRHNTVRDALVAYARSAAPRMMDVRVEPQIVLRPDAQEIFFRDFQTTAPSQCRADFSFLHPKKPADGGGHELVHADVTVASEVTPPHPGDLIPDVLHRALVYKTRHYRAISTIAAEPLFVQPLVFSSDCSMEKGTEAFVRWVCESQQVATYGYSNAVTSSRMMGDILASIVERQFAMKRKVFAAATAEEPMNVIATASQAGHSGRQVSTDARKTRVSPLVAVGERAARDLDSLMGAASAVGDPPPEWVIAYSSDEEPDAEAGE
jgi:hypothetical protein